MNWLQKRRKETRPMIDSIVLQLNSGQFKLREKNRFNEAKTQHGRGFSTDTKYCAEYSESWRKKGIYCPVFGLPTQKAGRCQAQEFLEIQVSLPKLVHGTNLFDVDIRDLEFILKGFYFFLTI